MNEVLWAGEYRIDSRSQRILRALRGGDWVYGGELRKAADLSENTQVFYRMENYLKPSELVVEAARAEERDARQFRLTEEGAEWVEEHAEEIVAPSTREEIAELAHEGYKAGTSAKESVQNYRKKVNRVKNRLDETREEVAEIADQQESDDTTLGVLWQRSEDNRDRSKRNSGRLDSMEEDAEAWATTEDVEGVSESVSRVEQRLSSVENKQAGIVRQQAGTERGRAELRALAKPAGYVALGAMGTYLVVLVVLFVFASELLASAVIAGIVAVLAIVFTGGLALYACGTEVSSVTNRTEGAESHVMAD